jgi:hypothetical protein
MKQEATVKVLSQETLMSLRAYVRENGRPLEAAHLAYLLGEATVAPIIIEQDGICTPTWDWGYDNENWQKARQMWIGILICKGVAVLKNFGRVEGI